MNIYKILQCLFFLVSIMKADGKKDKPDKEEKTNIDGKRRLYRSKDDQIVSGVFGGLADYLNVDPVILRIIGVVLFIAKPGEFIVFYIIASIIIPESDRKTVAINEKKSDVEKTSALREKKSDVDGSFLFGVALIVLGSVFLLQKFFSWFTFDYVWPFVLIGVGVYILLRR